MTDTAQETGSETTQAKPQQSLTSEKPNKYSDARFAKKKRRRAAHRATIKRSNANG